MFNGIVTVDDVPSPRALSPRGRCVCALEAPITIAPRIFCSCRDQKRGIKSYSLCLIRLSSSAPVSHVE
eukprot:6625154-Pyramimonas_sp.AAC.1